MDHTVTICSQESTILLKRAFNVERNKIRIIHMINETERQIVYDYLTTVYPKLPKTILLINSLDSKPRSVMPRYMQCSHCNEGRARPTYYYGILENNKDEYYAGNCNRCGDRVEYEPNYDDPDDFYKIIRCKNVIVIGNWFKGYNDKLAINFTTLCKERVAEILSRQKMYEVTAPDNNLLSRLDVCHYIDDAIVEGRSKILDLLN